jgi:hypothetical protein
VLEPGGSDPFILLSTDDLDASVKTAVSARLGDTVWRPGAIATGTSSRRPS